MSCKVYKKFVVEKLYLSKVKITKSKGVNYGLVTTLLIIIALFGLEYYMCEKMFSWEVEILKEVTAEYFRLRQQCEEEYPDCLTNIKLKVL
jgi:hypothetical protein